MAIIAVETNNSLSGIGKIGKAYKCNLALTKYVNGFLFYEMMMLMKGCSTNRVK